MSLLRLKYALKGRGKGLIKRIENPIKTLELAKEDLFTRAVSCQRQAETLKRKSVDDPLVTRLIERLENSAITYKEKYEEADKRIGILESKKLAAEATLELMRVEAGGGDPLSIIKDIEEDINRMEDEINAYLKLGIK